LRQLLEEHGAPLLAFRPLHSCLARGVVERLKQVGRQQGLEEWAPERGRHCHETVRVKLVNRSQILIVLLVAVPTTTTAAAATTTTAATTGRSSTNVRFQKICKHWKLIR
jgi:hypothetical protein